MNPKSNFWSGREYSKGLSFLTMLIMVVVSPFKKSFRGVPGWHTTIYPPKYFLVLNSVILLLLISCIGYAFFLLWKVSVSSKIFASHFLLTLPQIVAFLYPFQVPDLSYSTSAEFKRGIAQAEFLEFFLFALFAAGQLIFLSYCMKLFKYQYQMSNRRN